MSIDIDKNCQELGLTRDVYLRIMKKSVPQTAQDINDLDNSISNNDFEKISAIAHRLKGTFFNLRLNTMASAAKQINEIAKAGKDISLIKQNFSEFKQGLVEVNDVISNIQEKDSVS